MLNFCFNYFVFTYFQLIQMEISEDTFKYHHKRQEFLLKQKAKEMRKPLETDVF